MAIAGGTLTATSNASLDDPFGANAATLRITVEDPDGRVDLDNGVDPRVIVSRNDTLEIFGRQSHGNDDPFSGTLNLSEGATIDMSEAWEMDNGTINVNTQGILVGAVGAAATITGAAFTMDGGRIDLDGIDTLRFSSPFRANGGTIANAGLVIFNANSTIGGGTDVQMIGAKASLTVNEDVTVNIDDADFNLDGTDSDSNVITIKNGGILDLDLGAGADDSFGGIINLNGGELDVTTLGDNWRINGDVNVGGTFLTSEINGDEVSFISTTVTVGEKSTLEVNAPSVWNAGGNLVVNAGGEARFDGDTEFNGNGSFTGDGTLRTRGLVSFDAVTTINMPGGSVDLDGGDLVGNEVNIHTDTTINARTMADFGSANAINLSRLELTAASLTVNLTDPNAEWTLTSNSRLIIIAEDGSGIYGSDFNMAGSAVIAGNSN